MALSAEQVVNHAANRAWTPPPVLTVWQWADDNVWLAGDSPQRGKYRTDRTPYVRGVMECLSPSHPARHIAWMAGSQIGKTRVSLNWVGFKIDHDPQPMIITLPTQAVAKEWSTQRLTQLIDDTPALAGKIVDANNKLSGNTTYLKKIRGTAASIKIAWSTSAAKLRSTPAADLLSDEVDGFLGDVDGEGDPLFLLNRRFTNFPRGKHYMCSTPGVSPSRIEKEFLKGDRRYYFVPCPHCGHFQRLVFKRIRWARRLHGETVADSLDRYSGAHYVCIQCDREIPEKRHKTAMLAGGLWVATVEHPQLADEGFARDRIASLEPVLATMARSRFPSFHLPAFYSPVGWYSWAELAKDWEEAQGGGNSMKGLINTVFAESWKSPDSAVPDWEILKSRAEDYPINDEAVVPMRASFLTAAVDFQREWLQVELKAWGRGRESWSIGMWRVEQFDGGGNPLQTSDPKYREWLHEFLLRTWPHECGAQLPIVAMGMDTGERPDPVYEFARKHQPAAFGPTGCRVVAPRTVIPLKGASGHEQHQRLIVTISQESAAQKRGGVRIVSFGGGYGKQEFYGNIQLTRNQDGSYPSEYCHLPRAYDDSVFQGFVAEQRVVHDTSISWEKVYDRNEPLDLHVMNRAVANLVGIDSFNADRWAQMEQQLGIHRQAVVIPPVVNPAIAAESVPVPPVQPAQQSRVNTGVRPQRRVFARMKM